MFNDVNIGGLYETGVFEGNLRRQYSILEGGRFTLAVQPDDRTE